MFETFRDVIDLWATPDVLAGEINARVETVRKWRQRDSIPAEWWLSIISRPTAINAHVSLEIMARLAARTTAAAS